MSETPNKLIVLFTSGEYSDYGLSGLLYINKVDYDAAKEKLDFLEKQEINIHKNIRDGRVSGGMSPNQAQALYREAEKLKKERSKIWVALQETGQAVEYVELWQGEV